jgi:hypothetical protein
MNGPPGAPPDYTAPENARLLAAQAKSLRATLLRNRPPNLLVSAGELADVVEDVIA